ncbi:Glycosyl transferase, group 1 [Fulvivirga imtechensis AK7]|uniref:Glycosyl transferase, group 1 n=1 Tax=Fulvivirga imtechensis AK7 TaxID=1237149 RepID=L8JSY8_9BACT|nr:glycosyltransferase [Fulvivirga imtechensis]ELR70609.1 Glycosyl transferase, group 1 [Fulvivirga imtechensis AK7]
MGKRILLVVGSLKTGGAERVTVITGAELQKRGYDVHYVLQRNIIELPNDIPDDKIHILRKRNSQNKFYKFYALFIKLFFVCLRVRPAYVIAFSRVSSFLACFTFHRKIIARFDANPYILSKKQHRYADFVFKWPFIRKVVVPSTGMYDAVSMERARYKEKLVIIPNSLDVVKVTTLADAPAAFISADKFICAMGRLSEDKNFELLLNAFAKSEVRNLYKLVIIGDGRLKQKLHGMVSSLNITERVIFLGYLKNPYPVLKQADFLVNTSIKESFCNVILEALALSLPVVATDCTYGPSDMVKNNVNGYLIPTNDEAALIKMLDKIAFDSNTIEKLRNATKSSITSFELNNVIQQWIDLLK